MHQLKIKWIKKTALTIQVFEILSRLASVRLSCYLEFYSITMRCNYLLTAPFPRGLLKSFWRARKNVSVHQIFWSLPVKSPHEIHLWMYFQWQRELIMFSNESLSPLKALFWTTLHWQLELFDLVLFIFFPPSLPEGGTHPAERGRQLRSGLSCSGLFDKLLKMTGLGKFSGCSAAALTPLQLEANMGKTICLFLVG